MSKKLSARSALLLVGAMLTVLFFIAGQAKTAMAVTVTTNMEGTLVKGSLPEVYFVGTDNKRYVFPNEKVFFSWYADFSTVQTISDADLAALTIGGNVTYRPGTRLVKIESDPKVYAIGAGGSLHWISSEDLAKQLFGDAWAKQVDDVPVSDFTNYKTDTPVSSPTDFNATTERQNGSMIGGVAVPSFETSDRSEHDNNNRNVSPEHESGAFKIVSVSADLAAPNTMGDQISEVRDFGIVFSQPPTGARLTVTEKQTKALFYSEPVIRAATTVTSFHVLVGDSTRKLKAKTAYAWELVAYAAPNATAAQTATKSGEFTTAEAATVVPPTDTNTTTAAFQFCPVADNDLSQGCCVTGGGAFARASAALTAGTLIRSDSSTMVYYYAANGKRYVMTGKDVMTSWYNASTDLLSGSSNVCQNVKQISDAQMGAIMIGGNVGIRPGTYIIKIESSPKLYVVAHNRTIRPISVDVAQSLFAGAATARVKVVPDAYFTGYKQGSDVSSATDYSPTAEYNTTIENELAN